MFDDKSRYASLGTAEHSSADGRTIVYVLRRIVPPNERYQAAGVHRVTDSDRVDLIAHRSYGAGTAFWPIADANDTMHPDDLTATAGRALVIPIPQK